jgi:hypothetical protein
MKMKLWYVSESTDGVNYRIVPGWYVSGDSRKEAIADAKRQQRYGGGHGHLDVVEYHEPRIVADETVGSVMAGRELD